MLTLIHVFYSVVFPSKPESVPTKTRRLRPGLVYD